MHVNALQRWIRHLRRGLAFALGGLMLAMVGLNVTNVVARRGFGAAIPEADELMVFSMVWLVFLGAILVTADGRHLGFDLVSRRLSGRPRALHGIAIDVAIALLAGYVAVQSADVVGRLVRFDQRSMAAGIPMAIPHLAVLVGLAGTALLAAGRAVARIGGLMRDGAPDA